MSHAVQHQITIHMLGWNDGWVRVTASMRDERGELLAATAHGRSYPEKAAGRAVERLLKGA